MSRRLATALGALALLAPAAAAEAGLRPLGCFGAPGAVPGCAATAGLTGAAAAAVAPDGRHVYVAAYDEARGTLLTFARDPATGELTPAGCAAETARDGCSRAESLYGANDVAISPDGATVYVLGVLPGTVGVFRRDAQTGGLAQVQCFEEGGRSATCPRAPLENPAKFALTSEGRSLIVAGSHTTRFTVGRDGLLSDPVEDRFTGVRSPAAIATGPNPRAVYVAGGMVDRGKLVVLRRNPASGALSVRGCAGDGTQAGRPCARARGIRAPAALAVSPDGRAVYLAASAFTSRNPADPFGFDGVQHSSAVSVFAPARGAQRSCLLYAGRPGLGRGCSRAPRSRGPGFWGASAVAVAPDGRHAVAGFEKSRAVALLRRNRRTQRLVPAGGEGGCVRDPGRRSRLPRGCTVAAGIGAPTDVAFSPDSRSVYVTARGGTLVALALR